MTVHDLLVVGLGGCLGALSSFLLVRMFFGDIAYHSPRRTLCINVLGSFILSFVYFSLERSHSISVSLKGSISLFSFSFTGAFTSLSTFALESFVLGDDGQHTMLFLNLLATIILSIGAVLLGRLSVSLLGPRAISLAKLTYRLLRSVVAT